LATWLVPWGAIHFGLPAATVPSAIAAPLGETLRAVAQFGSVQVGRELAVTALLGYALAAASIAGLALFAGDCLALRRSVRRWRAASRPGESLRSLLPPELKAVPAEIRVVADSSIAAVSGYRTPTIWIGDRYAGEQLRLVVVHEMWHVQGRDPLWIGLIAAIRRVYWWNPLVAHLARQAILMIESTCDHRSAGHFGKPRYVTELASLVLAAATPAPRLLATVHAANLDVQRLRLLGTTLRLRARDLLVVAALGVGAAATALANVVDLEAGETSGSAQPAAPANVVPLSPRSPSADDAALLDEMVTSFAYTPQQYFGDPETSP
jgi:hypothetical protein